MWLPTRSPWRADHRDSEPPSGCAHRSETTGPRRPYRDSRLPGGVNGPPRPRSHDDLRDICLLLRVWRSWPTGEAVGTAQTNPPASFRKTSQPYARNSRVCAARSPILLNALTSPNGCSPNSGMVGPSQRLQELDDGDLIALRQLPKAVGHIARFAAMPHDGVA